MYLICCIIYNSYCLVYLRKKLCIGIFPGIETANQEALWSIGGYNGLENGSADPSGIHLEIEFSQMVKISKIAMLLRPYIQEVLVNYSSYEFFARYDTSNL